MLVFLNKRKSTWICLWNSPINGN